MTYIVGCIWRRKFKIQINLLWSWLKFRSPLCPRSRQARVKLCSVPRPSKVVMRPRLIKSRLDLHMMNGDVPVEQYVNSVQSWCALTKKICTYQPEVHWPAACCPGSSVRADEWAWWPPEDTSSWWSSRLLQEAWPAPSPSRRGLWWLGSCGSKPPPGQSIKHRHLTTSCFPEQPVFSFHPLTTPIRSPRPYSPASSFFPSSFAMTERSRPLRTMKVLSDLSPCLKTISKQKIHITSHTHTESSLFSYNFFYLNTFKRTSVHNLQSLCRTLVSLHKLFFCPLNITRTAAINHKRLKVVSMVKTLRPFHTTSSHFNDWSTTDGRRF